MRRNVKRGVLLLAVFALILAGCGTFSFAISGHGRDVPLYQKGQVVDIQGKIDLNRNQITLEDQNSDVVFRFVGLRPAERKALSDLDGRITRVLLKVISVESARACNAQFVRFSARD